MIICNSKYTLAKNIKFVWAIYGFYQVLVAVNAKTDSWEMQVDCENTQIVCPPVNAIAGNNRLPVSY